MSIKTKKPKAVKIDLYADRVLVVPDKAEEKTKSGIIIPETAQVETTNGTVVAVGPGMADRPMKSKVGDHIMYGKFSGTPIKLPNDDTDYMIMRETDVWAGLIGEAK